MQPPTYHGGGGLCYVMSYAVYHRYITVSMMTPPESAARQDDRGEASRIDLGKKSREDRGTRATHLRSVGESPMHNLDIYSETI